MLDKCRILNADCVRAMRLMAARGILVDAVITDPPYHLTSIVKRFGKPDSAPAKTGKTGAYARHSKGFMGQEWDGGDVAFRRETWEAVLSVMKPGAFLIAFAAGKTYHKMATAIDDAGFRVVELHGWLNGQGFPKSHPVAEGLGTATLPALEPMCLAQKPISEKTIAANVKKWGTGALNIDAARVGDEEITINLIEGGPNPASGKAREYQKMTGTKKVIGRWPQNVIHDGSPEVLEKLGKAANFYYLAKAGREDRLGFDHPTIKPVSAMRQYVRLLSPNIEGGALILDPFAGTGTTGAAAAIEGQRSILIEREKKYAADCRKRMLRLGGVSEGSLFQDMTGASA